MSGIEAEKQRAAEMVKLIKKIGGTKESIVDGEGYNFPLLRIVQANGGVDGTEALMERDPELRRQIMRHKRRKAHGKKKKA